MALVIRRSQIHADGVYTTEPIKRRTIVAEYTGPRLTYSQADEIYEYSPRTYLFGMGDGERVVDGDGIAAFINHSCDPNCDAVIDDKRIWIETIRDIEPGEELAYDYAYILEERHTPAAKRRYPCSCGAAGCRGTILGKKR
jgi:SET domain-containing protein